jgi:ubiquinone/menaquinone biosynthesis C-methylase UbiE
MSNIDRWKLAQSAEAKHETHSELTRSTSWTKGWLDERFALPLDYLHDKDILEVGCGTGMIHSFDFPCNNVGIDPILSDIRGVVEQSPARLVEGAGEDLPFPDNSFDIVINYNVLDHTKHPEQTVEECYRVLVAGGDMLFSVNTFDSPSLMRRVADFVDPPHPHHFNIPETRSMLTEAGFTVDVESIRELELDSFKGRLACSLFGLEQYNARLVK